MPERGPCPVAASSGNAGCVPANAAASAARARWTRRREREPTRRPGTTPGSAMLRPMGKPETMALVSVRERREQIIQWLSEQFTRDALDMDELDRRLDLAHQATSIEDLDRLVADLAPMDQATPSLSLAPRPSPALDAVRPARKRMVAALGGIKRAGQWLVPRELRVTAFMGGVSLDFREAVLPPGVTRVRIAAVMGGVEIIVPPHVAVQTDGFAFMGGFEEVHRAPPAPDPDMPVLEISGLAVMGGVEISTRVPRRDRRLLPERSSEPEAEDEPERQAKRKAERKARRSSRHDDDYDTRYDE